MCPVPLALELAAARVPMLGIDGLRQRLVDGLSVPGSHVADDDRRQATIESTVNWSLALLSPDARLLFDELSVFPSWFDIAALENVSTVGDVIDPLGEILDSSLVVVHPQRPAYRLLEPVRQVARRQLSHSKQVVITDRYLEWTADLVREIDVHWRADQRYQAQELVIKHRHDLRTALTYLAERGDAERHGHDANILTRALLDRADSELIEACRVAVGPSVEGELARCMLAWNQGDPDASVAIAERIATTIDDASPYWPFLHWAVAGAHLYRGDVDAVAQCAQIVATQLHGYDSMRSETISLWALAVLYQDRPDDAAAVLSDHAAIVERSTSAGSVTFTRAEIKSVSDPDAAMALFAEAARDAAACAATFNQRIVEVAQLAHLVRTGRTEQVSELACRLAPELLRAGLYPQAWLTLRHIAGVLGQLGEPDLAILVLDSANADDGAATVVGEAARVEATLRASLVDHPARTGDEPPTPMAIGHVWEAIEPALQLDARSETGH